MFYLHQIAINQSIKFEYPTDYRKCERVACQSFELANIIWNKIKLYFNRDDIENIRPFGFGNDGIWRPTNIISIMTTIVTINPIK